MPVRQTINGERVPVFVYTDGIDAATRNQLERVASLRRQLPVFEVTQEVIDCHHNKDIDTVMTNQIGLVETVHELRQIVCVKG